MKKKLIALCFLMLYCVHSCNEVPDKEYIMQAISKQKKPQHFPVEGISPPHIREKLSERYAILSFFISDTEELDRMIKLQVTEGLSIECSTRMQIQSCTIPNLNPLLRSAYSNYRYG